MFTYAGFITLTPEGRETFEKAPEYLDEFKHYIEAESGTLEDIFAVMGPWDFFFLAKYPDNAAAFRALAKDREVRGDQDRDVPAREGRRLLQGVRLERTGPEGRSAAAYRS